MSKGMDSYNCQCLMLQVRVNVAVGPVASTSGRSAAAAAAAAGLGGKHGKKATEQRVTPSGLQASYLICQSDEKLAQLLHFLQVGPATHSPWHSYEACFTS